VLDFYRLEPYVIKIEYPDLVLSDDILEFKVTVINTEMSPRNISVFVALDRDGKTPYDVIQSASPNPSLLRNSVYRTYRILITAPITGIYRPYIYVNTTTWWNVKTDFWNGTWRPIEVWGPIVAAVGTDGVPYLWFGDWFRLGGTAYGIATAACVQQKRVYVVVRGGGNTIWWGYFSGGRFSGWRQLSGSTPSAPALTYANGILYIAVRGGDNRVWVNWINPVTQTYGTWTNIGRTTYDAPAIAANKTIVSVVVRGTDNNIYVRHLSLPSLTPVSSWSELPIGGSTPSAPVATYFKNKLIVAVRGFDNFVYIGDGKWSGLSGLTTYLSPALTAPAS